VRHQGFKKVSLIGHWRIDGTGEGVDAKNLPVTTSHHLFYLVFFTDAFKRSLGKVSIDVPFAKKTFWFLIGVGLLKSV
jgi:hypothetical protein